ncbi:MAG: REP-associated tyrosine transposase [Pseudomonas sp.]
MVIGDRPRFQPDSGVCFGRPGFPRVALRPKHSARRQPILTNADIRSALREGLTLVRQTLPFRIDCWVLLPDHLHAIWTLPEGGSDFSTRWRLIKRHVTLNCGPAYIQPEYLHERRMTKGCGTLWQPRVWEQLIHDERDLRQHLDYLHGSPRKHGVVGQVRDWPWSLLHRHVRQGICPTDWAGSGNQNLNARE